MVDTKFIPEFLNNIPKEKGVYHLSQINKEFEDAYLKIRAKENRIYSDEGLIELPFTTPSNQHHNEWELRVKSFNRFQKYLLRIDNTLSILDLGCGNCWFSGRLSRSTNHHFFCVDINLSELEQGARVFKDSKIEFIYANIFDDQLPLNFFDMIILNASIQYFPALNKLIEKLLRLSKTNGEIHILDSPFYSHSEVKSARQRTVKYYESMGFPEMSKRYFHHTYQDLSEFNYCVLFNPQSLKVKALKLFFKKDIPFPWILIKK